MASPYDLIGTAEAAQTLGLSHKTIYRMVEDGRLTPAMKGPGGPNGSFLFNRSDIDELAKAVA
jgi:excisionase family DNA binding protein